MSYNLHTEVGDKINGTVHPTIEDLLDAVRSVYGADCDFGEIDGAIIDASGELVATFGEN